MKAFWLPLLVFCLCMPPHSAATGTTGPPAAAVEKMESETYKLLNDHRRSMGLSTLAYDARIAAIARRHSEDMAAGRIPVGHAGFESRRQAIERTIPPAAIAENVGYNDYPLSRTVRVSVSGWLNSRGHRENIEGRYDITGVGIASDGRGAWYYTQIFVKRGKGDP